MNTPTPRLAVKLAPKMMRTVYLLILPLTAVITAVAIGLLLLGATRSGIALLVLDVVLILPTVANLYMLFRPIYTIDHRGIEIKRVGLVPWSDIAVIDLVTRNGFTLIGIRTHHGQVRLRNNLMWLRMSQNPAAWPHRDIYLPLSLTAVPPPKIVEAIETHKTMTLDVA